jgi:Zn-dependent M16 (insulinase) family peptidase
MADSKDKQPQEWLQEMMGQMTSQMGGMAGTADPIGAMKSLQRVAESWAQNPQELAEAVKTWSEQITATNQQVWQEFLNQKAAAPTDPEGKADWSKLPYFKWIREYYQTYAGWMEQNIQNAPVEEDVK